MARLSLIKPMENNRILLDLLAAAAAGRLHQVPARDGYPAYAVANLGDSHRRSEWQRVDEALKLMVEARWLRDVAVLRADSKAWLWLPSDRGWRVLKRHGLAVEPIGRTRTPTGRLRAEPGNHAPQVWSGEYRAAVFCEAAAQVMTGREPLWRGCSADGVRRWCKRCVYCLLEEARHRDYGWSGLGVSEADRAESLVTAFEAVEVYSLDTAPPFDLGQTVDLLVCAAADLRGRVGESRVAG